eukprot:Colp12_sorted_trinity150504_noHs@13784
MATLGLSEAGLLALGMVGSTFSTLQFWSAIPTFRRMELEGVGQDELFPSYYTMYIGNICWFVYGALIQSIPLMISNGSGMLCTAYYVDTIYYLSANKRTMKICKFFGWAWLVSVALSTAYRPGTTDDKYELLGILNTVQCEITYISPVVNLYKTFKTRNPRSSPFLPGLMMSIMGVIWGFYGIGEQNWPVIITSFTGAVFGVLQVVAFLIFVDKKTLFQNPIKAMPTLHKFFAKRQLSSLNAQLPEPDPVKANVARRFSFVARFDEDTGELVPGNKTSADILKKIAGSRITEVPDIGPVLTEAGSESKKETEHLMAEENQHGDVEMAVGHEGDITTEDTYSHGSDTAIVSNRYN